MNPPPDLSICIVSYNARAYLRACLDSILENTHRVTCEIILVDNHSEDGSADMLAERYPQVHCIRNQHNDGFARPANRAIAASRGRHILLLNPDSLVHGDALEQLVRFLDENPAVGIVGPRILNRNGSLQRQCRRSEGRPWDAFCYLTGLSGLFPHDRRFSGYLMSYIDEEEMHEVQAVSGACMLVRGEVFDQVGVLDERFFAYQEDSDLCYRVRQAGWKVFYLPAARITHFGGKGGAGVHPYRSLYEWHRSYFLYYRKHFARPSLFLFNWMLYALIWIKFLAALILNLFRREKVIGSRKD